MKLKCGLKGHKGHYFKIEKVYEGILLKVSCGNHIHEGSPDSGKTHSPYYTILLDKKQAKKIREFLK